MRRTALAFILIFTIMAGVAFGATYVSSSLKAQNTFTSSISPTYNTNTGWLNVSISGTWAGTVTLQRSFNSGSTWLDVDTWTSNTEEALVDREPSVIYRIGFKTGEYTSGTAVCRLSKGD